MKTYLYLKRTVSVIFILSLFLCGACKKDKNNNPVEGYRISEETYVENDSLIYTAKYQYKDNQLSVSRSYDYSQGDSLKTEFHYPDENTIEEELFMYYDSVWYPTEKLHIEFEDGHIVHVEDIYFYVSYWEPEFELDMQYTGNNLVEEVWSYYLYGMWNPYRKISYTYNENKPVTATYYAYDNDWSIYYKEEGVFTGENVVQVTGYSYAGGSFTNSVRYDINYNGDFLSSIDIYYPEADWQLAGHYIFTYDSFGNLISESVELDDFSSKNEYYYQEGQGNFARLHSEAGGLLSYRYYPIPTKSSPINQESKENPFFNGWKTVNMHKSPVKGLLDRLLLSD